MHRVLSVVAAAVVAISAAQDLCDSMSMTPKFHPIGLGTYEIPRDEMTRVLRHAILEVGYRRIDCAAVYFNEDAVGDALASMWTTDDNNNDDSHTVDRSALYLVSKLASPFHRKEHVEIAVKKTLQDLRTDYLDLYLIHWPVAFHYVPLDMTQRGYADQEIDEGDHGKRIDPTVSIHETWEAMEALVDQGLVRDIGVSNFPVSLLHELMTKCRIPPAVNQCEGHPYLQQPKLLKYCQARGVQYQAYSPLGTPGYKAAEEPSILQDPVLQGMAQQHNCTTAQIALAWAIQRGTTVVVKTTSLPRMKENLVALDITLSTEEMQAITGLDRNYRFFRPEDWWPNHPVFD